VPIQGDNSQSGDHTSRDAAGENIYHQGIESEQVFNLVRFIFEDRHEREARREELDHTLNALRDQVQLYRITTTERIEAVAKWQRHLAWAMAGLAVGAFIIGGILLALVVDRFVVLALVRVLAFTW
jgi:hypothetical protein